MYCTQKIERKQHFTWFREKHLPVGVFEGIAKCYFHKPLVLLEKMMVYILSCYVSWLSVIRSLGLVCSLAVINCPPHFESGCSFRAKTVKTAWNYLFLGWEGQFMGKIMNFSPSLDGKPIEIILTHKQGFVQNLIISLIFS